jgi:hypothetical protein
MTKEELIIFRNLVEDAIRFAIAVEKSGAAITYTTAVSFNQSLGVARELLRREEQNV